MENHYYKQIDFSFFFIFFMVKDKTIFYLKKLLSITEFIDFLSRKVDKWKWNLCQLKTKLKL